MMDITIYNTSLLSSSQEPSKCLLYFALNIEFLPCFTEDKNSCHSQITKVTTLSQLSSNRLYIPPATTHKA